MLYLPFLQPLRYPVANPTERNNCDAVGVTAPPRGLRVLQQSREALTLRAFPTPQNDSVRLFGLTRRRRRLATPTWLPVGLLCRSIVDFGGSGVVGNVKNPRRTEESRVQTQVFH